MNMTLFGSKVFADDEVKMRSLDEKSGHRERHKVRVPSEQQGKDRDVSTRQTTPKIENEPPASRGEAWNRFHQSPQKESALLTP